MSCAQQFPATGLWPICDAPPLKIHRGWDFAAPDGKPYWLDPYGVPDHVFDVTNLPDREDYFQEPDEPDFFRELLMDHGMKDTSMVLAEASTFPANPLSRVVAPVGPDRLTLIACRRPSDSVLMLDFGVANDAATPGICVGVLRTWESRFGVVPVMLRSAWTAFQVLAPPRERTAIERLATEVFSFASDSGMQGGFYAGSLGKM